KLLKRTAKTVILCYDGDDAGLQASYEAATILQKNGSEVKVARLKDGLDPDDYIKSFGGEQFRNEVLDTSDTFFKFLLQYKKSKYNMSIDSERIRYIEEMTKELATLESPIEREYYAREIADEFELSEQVILNDLEKQRTKINGRLKDNLSWNRNTNININNSSQKMLPAYIRAEKALLAHMINYPQIIDRV